MLIYKARPFSSMLKARKHTAIEKLAIMDITLAELVPAELIMKPVNASLEATYLSEHFMGSAVAPQPLIAYMNDINIIIPVAALAIAIPLLYKIESKLYDNVYLPAAKRLSALLRHDRYKKPSESFK